jgi:hypothetical protein
MHRECSQVLVTDIRLQSLRDLNIQNDKLHAD